MEQIRLQKFLADNGIASRRKCEELILQGRVRVNGEQINTLGTKINPNKDIIEYNGREIKNSTIGICIGGNEDILPFLCSANNDDMKSFVESEDNEIKFEQMIR